MDQFTRDDLRALLRNDKTPCVSMLMPTTRETSLGDKTRWKNQIREAEERLKETGQRGPDAKDLLAAARERLDEEPFWLNVPVGGLAGFFAPGVAHVFRTPLPLQEKVVVGDRFHVKPLLPLLTAEGRFFVLALSMKHVRLLECTQFTDRAWP